LKPVRVIINPQTGGADESKSVRGGTLEQVEQYTIESAIDTDSDTWRIDVGDPAHELIALLRRDVEIGVTLMGGENNTQFLKTGFTDQAGYTEQGTLELSGRDISSVATDSTHPPGDWKNVRVHKRITQEGSELGIKKFRLASTEAIAKEYTDGSETYWEFWYRMARKKKMWLWCEPDGTLVMDELNYDVGAKYFFGKPTDKFKGGGKAGWLGVKVCEIKKNTQQRVGEVFYFGENETKPFHYSVVDPSIRKWVRRPIKVVFDSDVKSMKEAKEAAWEEIFEGKVGSVEITLTVADPGYLIRQNNMAAINIPELGIDGVYYIVGVIVGGAPGEGFTQIIRLREKNFALSRRVPDDPKLAEDPSSSIAVGSTVGTFDIAKPEWSDYFWRAAQKWHGKMSVDKFCVMIMGICSSETGMRNVREKHNNYSGSGITANAPDSINNGEWFPFPHPGVTMEEYKIWFSNDPGPYTAGKDVGVGPGQLTSPSFKTKADNYGHKKGELDGGRWMPEWSIFTMGEIMNGHLAGRGDEGMNDALESYAGRGSPFAARLIENVNDYIKANLPGVQAAIEQGQTTADGSVALPADTPPVVERAINVAMKQLGKPYQMYGAGPSVFDCSGLLVYSYKVASNGDIMLPHFTGSMYAQYPHVSKENLLPGDGVFFHVDHGHMGMYLGGGNFIQAPSSGDVVKITSLGSRSDYSGAVRFVRR
jgi:cell wall-associated NlpC family hydrolase/prophage tail gpP-like protein